MFAAYCIPWSVEVHWINKGCARVYFRFCAKWLLTWGNLYPESWVLPIVFSWACEQGEEKELFIESNNSYQRAIQYQQLEKEQFQAAHPPGFFHAVSNALLASLVLRCLLSAKHFLAELAVTDPSRTSSLRWRTSGYTATRLVA